MRMKSVQLLLLCNSGRYISTKGGLGGAVATSTFFFIISLWAQCFFIYLFSLPQVYVRFLLFIINVLAALNSFSGIYAIKLTILNGQEENLNG